LERERRRDEEVDVCEGPELMGGRWCSDERGYGRMRLKVTTEEEQE